jgi:antitoxin (DNA-binding transcriptional repressor) of toxin-antitoxin stability system
MKTVPLEVANLDTCVREAQGERVVLTRGGQPVALIVGIEGLDEEQVALGASDKFWRMIAQRRGQASTDRATLEQSVKPPPKP